MSRPRSSDGRFPRSGTERAKRRGRVNPTGKIIIYIGCDSSNFIV